MKSGKSVYFIRNISNKVGRPYWELPISIISEVLPRSVNPIHVFIYFTSSYTDLNKTNKYLPKRIHEIGEKIHHEIAYHLKTI